MIDPRAHDTVRRILDELENKLDPRDHADIRRRHIAASMWGQIDRPPVLLLPEWDEGVAGLYPISEAVEDPSKMLVNELRKGLTAPLEWLQIRDDRLLQIRPDFGICLVASVFGAKVDVVKNNPPWVHPLAQDPDAIESTLNAALDKLDVATSHQTGWLPRVDETLDYYEQVFAEYPKVKASVAITLPPLQGPFETAAMLWGSDIFLALLTSPQLVDRLLLAVGGVMVHLHRWLRRWIGRELLPEGFSHQHGSLIRGNLLLRCDSVVMINPKMYQNQVLPHDCRVLQAMGGGSFHSCGDWTQNMPAIIAADEIGSLDLGVKQSSFYDIDQVYQQAQGRHKHLNLITVTPDELTSGTVLNRFPTGATLYCSTANKDNAADIMSRYI